MEYLLWVLVALVAYSLTAPLTSVIANDVPAESALFLSTGVFLVLTLGVMVVTGVADPSYALLPETGYVYVAGVFLAVGILAYFEALADGPVSVVVPIYGMFIVGSSAVSIAFLGETLTPLRGAGIACAAAAIYLGAGDGQ